MSSNLEIDEEKLVLWIENKFRSYKKYHGDYLVNSPFKEDRKFKLSISPSKKCYHCWKTDKSGPLWKLVEELDNCSTSEAKNKIFTKVIVDLETKLQELKMKNSLVVEKEIKKENLPDFFSFISKDTSIEVNNRALNYCLTRKIDPFKWRLGYCYDGKYSRRLIIPFFDQEDNVFYWNARSLYGQEPKYLNPSNSDKESFIFSKYWDFSDKDVFVTEGVFNTIVLNDLGFISVSIQGKNLSEKQYLLIKNARSIIFAFDSDSAGERALFNSKKGEIYSENIIILKENGFNNIRYIFPYLENHDWNDLLIKDGRDKLRDYIFNNQKDFGFKSVLLDKIKGIK